MKRQDEKQDGNATFFENLLLFVLLIVMLATLTPGCAGTKGTVVTTGSDNATVVSSAGSGLTVPQLIQYVNLAEQEALTAWQLYEATKDATALQKVTWWLKYSSGVAEKIEALSATGS